MGDVLMKARSGGHAFIHPALERRHMVLRPRVVARHAAVFQGFVNLLGLLFDLSVGRKIKPIPLHGHDIGLIAKERMSAAKLRGIGFPGRPAASPLWRGQSQIVCPTLGRSQEKWKSANT
jgi:hypothetical protein